MGLTLREGDREYFYKNMDKYFHGMKEKYQKRYGNNYILTSDNNKELMEIFNSARGDSKCLTARLQTPKKSRRMAPLLCGATNAFGEGLARSSAYGLDAVGLIANV
jgi:hypothetical protein